MKRTLSLHSGIGKEGEDVACMFLMKRGYKIVERNHLRKWGEIDIVAEKNKRLHFVEVKSVSDKGVYSNKGNVTHVTSQFRPEDNVHFRKKQRLSRVFQTYLADNHKENFDWQFDLITVYFSPKDNKAAVHFIKDIII
jgi:putative endonuclease